MWIIWSAWFCLAQEELYKLLAEKNTYDNSTIEGSRLRALVASFDYNEFLSLMLSYSDESYEDHDGQGSGSSTGSDDGSFEPETGSAHDPQ